MLRRLRITLAIVIIFSLIGGDLFSLVKPALAASLTSGSVALSDSRINQTTVSYTITFSNVTTSPIKCIKAQFSDAATGGSKPTGLTISSATFSGTSTYVPTPASWAISNNNTSGVSSITYATGETPAAASSRTVVLAGITNGSTAETGYYLQFSTYNNVDCSTSPVDSAVIMFIYTNGQAVSLTVDPSLSFTVTSRSSSTSVNGATTNITTTSTTVPFGVVTSSTNAIAAQRLTVSTNAAGGYTVFTRYSGALTNASLQTITDHTGTNAAPTAFSAAGTESFGYTTADSSLGTGTADRFTSSGGNKWAAFTTSNAEVAYNNSPASAQTTDVGYQVGIAGGTEAGVYTTTVIYTATPTY
ncbi:hypothetical protein HGA91_05115 [candidate division WWE3 bacterium]|nr:hypothetical protein [candidate division WWE3 bacterium]